MKGYVFIGGSGMCLHPATLAGNKRLLSVDDKPIIYHLLSVLMLARIRDILILSSSECLQNYRSLPAGRLADQSSIRHAEQPALEGLAQAFTIGREIIRDDAVVLGLSDSLFFGAPLTDLLARALTRNEGAIVVSYRSEHPQRYCVVQLDGCGPAFGLDDQLANRELATRSSAPISITIASSNIRKRRKSRGGEDMRSVTPAVDTWRRAPRSPDRWNVAMRGPVRTRRTACTNRASSCGPCRRARETTAPGWREVLYGQSFITYEQTLERGAMFAENRLLSCYFSTGQSEAMPRFVSRST